MKFFKDANAELKEMLKSAVHFGHYTNKWNPKMKNYIYNSRSGVHVFDLHKTLNSFDKALVYLSELKAQGKVILFVSTKQQATPIVTKTAMDVAAPFVTYKWIPGLLTNYATVSKRIGELKKLKRMKEEGDFEGYTKKEISKIEKKMVKLNQALGGVESLDKVPDCLFVIDVVRDFIAVKEAKKIGIPVVAIVDTNGDPDNIDYAIPANDDAIKSLTYIMGKVKEALTVKK
jgi:small subunit ribosomal protein S2